MEEDWAPTDMSPNADELFYNIYEWFEDKNLHDPIMQYAKVNEEVGEIGREVVRGGKNIDNLSDAIGDSIITLIGMAHAYNLNPTECLRSAWREIEKRKGKIVNGNFIKEQDMVQ